MHGHAPQGTDHWIRAALRTLPAVAPGWRRCCPSGAIIGPGSVLARNGGRKQHAARFRTTLRLPANEDLPPVSTEPTVSIVIPAKNEAIGLGALLRSVRRLHPEAELIVVDDGSDDETAEIAGSVDGVTCISHPVSIGNGGEVKTGARHASGDRLVFMDGDGQHRPEEISRLLEKMDEGFHLVVGARVHAGQASPRQVGGEPLLQQARVDDDRICRGRSDFGLPSVRQAAFPDDPLSAPEPLLLPDNEHHGVLPLRLLRLLRRDRREAP